MLYGPGQTEMSRRESDVWLWQLVGLLLTTPLYLAISITVVFHSLYTDWLMHFVSFWWCVSLLPCYDRLYTHTYTYLLPSLCSLPPFLLSPPLSLSFSLSLSPSLSILLSQEGSSHVTMDKQEYPLSAGDSLLIPGLSQWVGKEGWPHK